MDMQAEDQQLTDHVLELILEDLVALGLGDLLVLPVRERMRSRRGDPQARGLEQGRERTAQGRDLGARLADVGADLRARLDDRLHHLGLDLLPKTRPSGGNQRLAGTLELALGIDYLELFLDPDRETRDGTSPHTVTVPRRPVAPLSASIIPRWRASWRMPVAIQIATVPYWVGDESHGIRSASSSAGRVMSACRTSRTPLSANSKAPVTYSRSSGFAGRASFAQASSSMPMPVWTVPRPSCGKPHFAA